MSCSYLELSGLLAILYFLLYKPLSILYRWHQNRNATAYEAILKPAHNDYAVITGATDGIGLEYARQLAQRGYNLVLLSRTEEKLKKVASEIRENYPKSKKVEYLAVNFTRTDIYEQIQKKLESLDGPIHVLVNNVGMVHPTPDYFASFPEGYNLDLINVNIVSVTLMSEIVLKIWAKQKTCPVPSKRPRGVIINISSMAGLAELPLFSTYSASKSYMNYLSKILSIEYAKDNILVQTVTPNLVDTNMAKQMHDHDDASAVTPKDFVEYALKAVGSEQQTSAHPKHKLINSGLLTVRGLICDAWFAKFGLYVSGKVKADAEKRNKSN